MVFSVEQLEARIWHIHRHIQWTLSQHLTTTAPTKIKQQLASIKIMTLSHHFWLLQQIQYSWCNWWYLISEQRNSLRYLTSLINIIVFTRWNFYLIFFIPFRHHCTMTLIVNYCNFGNFAIYCEHWCAHNLPLCYAESACCQLLTVSVFEPRIGASWESSVFKPFNRLRKSSTLSWENGHLISINKTLQWMVLPKLLWHKLPCVINILV